MTREILDAGTVIPNDFPAHWLLAVQRHKVLLSEIVKGFSLSLLGMKISFCCHIHDEIF